MTDTGASPEQIEAAAAKWTGCPENDRPVYREVVAGYAADLVPPGSLVFEPEDVAAVRLVLDELNALTGGRLYGDVRDAARRLAALVEGS